MLVDGRTNSLFLEKLPRLFNGEITVSSTNSAGTAGYPLQKGEVRPLLSHNLRSYLRLDR